MSKTGAWLVFFCSQRDQITAILVNIYQELKDDLGIQPSKKWLLDSVGKARRIFIEQRTDG